MFLVVLLLVWGVTSIWLGLRIRAGGLRGKPWEALVRNRRLPAPLRNMTFTLIPGGAMIGGLGLSLGAFELGAPRAVGFWLGVLATSFMLLGLLTLVAPPAWLKPAWLREQENRGH